MHLFQKTDTPRQKTVPYDKDGYDEQNFNRRGFNRDTGTKLDKNGFASKRIMQKKAELEALKQKSKELDRYLDMAEKVAKSKELQKELDMWRKPKEIEDDQRSL